MIFHVGYDGIKYIDKIVDCQRIIKELSPQLYADIESGELHYPILLEDEPLKGTILNANKGTGLYLKLHGSGHTQYNHINGKGCTNFNRFNIEHTIKMVTSFNPSDFIRDNLLFYKEIKPLLSHDKRVYVYKEYETTNFYVKIYDKGLQYNLKYYLLRIEIKFRNRRAIEDHGIYSMNDMTVQSKFDALYVLLREVVSNLTIIDSHDLPDIATKKEKQLFKTFTSAYRLRKQRDSTNRETIRNKRNEFQAVLQKYGLNKIKTEIESIIDENHVFETKNEIDQNDGNLTFTTIHISGNRQTKTYGKRKKDEIPISDLPPNKKPRNTESNPRNNLARRIRKIVDTGSLFSIAETITLTEDQIKELDYWKGTDFDILGQLGLRPTG